MKSIITLALATGLVLSSSVWVQAQNCTSRYNPGTRQTETHCSDGTRATERYNPGTRQSETTITQPGGQQQHCYSRYNPGTRQTETHCN